MEVEMIEQKGVALITVLMLLVLLSTMAIYTAEEQDISIRMVSNIKEAEQAFQIAAGGEQWAVKLLEKDMDNDRQQGTPDYDHLNEEIWRNLGPPVKVEGTESFMQVSIFDEQGKFNLNNLIQGKPATEIPEENQQPSESESPENESAENKVSLSWYEIFQRLLLTLELDPLLVDVIVDWIDNDGNTTGTTGAEDLYYSSLSKPFRSANQQLTSVAELTQLRGFTVEIISQLSPFVSAIPLRAEGNFTRININTAPMELFGALTEQVVESNDEFIPVIELRAQTPFESVDDFVDVFSANVAVSLRAGIEPFLDVKSDYFISRSCAETGRVKLSQISLLHKNRNKENVSVEYRQSNHGCPEFEIPGSLDNTQPDM